MASADYGRCQRAKPWTCGDQNVLVKCYSNRIKKNHHLNFSKKRTNYRIGRGAKKQEGRNKQAKEQQVAQLADRKRQLPGRRPHPWARLFLARASAVRPIAEGVPSRAHVPLTALVSSFCVSSDPLSYFGPYKPASFLLVFPPAAALRFLRRLLHFPISCLGFRFASAAAALSIRWRT